MRLTGISEINQIYFTHLCPAQLLLSDRCIKLGVLSDEDEPVSICVMDVRDGNVWIRWIYTDPERRGQGAATFLLEEILHRLEHMDPSGIEVDFSSEDDGLEDFLQDHGFLVGEDRTLYRIPLKDILYSTFMDELLERRSEVPGIRTLSDPHKT